MKLGVQLVVVASIAFHGCNVQKVVTDWTAELDQIHEPKLDPEWRDYVDKLAGEYDEILAVTRKNDDVDPKRIHGFLDWSPMSPFEVPYLAILYTPDGGKPSEWYKEVFKGDPDPGQSHIEPRTACGGALLSPKHVLTVCGCMDRLVYDLFGDLPRPLFPWNDNTPSYELKNRVTGPKSPPTVYVTFSLLQFVPDETHKVDMDKSQWPVKDELNCRSIIRAGGNTDDPVTRARRAEGELMVVPITPASKAQGTYPVWPPTPIDSKTDPGFKKQAVIASMGMRVVQPTKIKFHSSIQASSLEAIHCITSNEICNRTVFQKLNTYQVCFCPITKGRSPQIVGGVIGWPAADDGGNLVGLTATGRRSVDGSVVVAMVTAEHKSLIEDYIGKSVLINQNVPSIMYRQMDLKKEFQIYDYWAAKFRTPTPVPYSGGITLGPILFNSFLTFSALLNCFI